jgi:curved DNA-binding protein CbpA
MGTDPYATLGISAAATEAELRTAYRRLAQLHHPDHNGGSAESAMRFAEIQEAYAHVKLLRRSADRPSAGPADDALEAKIAQMEGELRHARTERERATRHAERTQHTPPPRPTPSRPTPTDERAPRPSREELGYVSTDDSFSKILDDFADEVVDQVADARRAARDRASEGEPAPRRRPRSVSAWIDELGSRLTGGDR